LKRTRAWALGLLVLSTALAVGLPSGRGATEDRRGATPDPREAPGPRGCTVFTIAKDGEVFFGGNDDYVNPDSYYWIDPGDGGNYGAIWIGLPDNVQQGVNEKGLAYDSNGLPRVEVNPHDEREHVSGGYTSYPIHILQECATVEEVVAWVLGHQWHSFMHDQMHFADASGDAVIVSAGADGELALTRKPTGDGFLVSSNFNVARPANGTSYPCWRYDLATESLDRLMRRGGPVTARDAADVLEAVHVEGAAGWTLGSMVADLTRGLVDLYYFYQFESSVRLNVAEELAHPRAPGPLSRLFPNEVREEAARRYRTIREKAERCRRWGLLWAALVLISLLTMIALPDGRRRTRGFWVPAALLLGPLALAVRIAAGPGRPRSPGRAALLEVLGDAMSSVVAFLAILLVLILVPAAQSSAPLQLMLVFGLPLALGWLVIHGPLLAPAAKKGLGRVLRERLPHEIVTANLGLAGAAAVVMPLVNLTLRMCTLFPLKAEAVLLWWGIVALAMLAGGALLFLYEGWAVKRGFRAWSALAWRETDVRAPSWRGLRWWVPLSYAALVAGIAVGAVLSRALSS
jgi:hypothetical protein